MERRARVRITFRGGSPMQSLTCGHLSRLPLLAAFAFAAAVEGVAGEGELDGDLLGGGGRPARVAAEVEVNALRRKVVVPLTPPRGSVLVTEMGSNQFWYHTRIMYVHVHERMHLPADILIPT